MDIIRQDIRHAARALLKSPGFTVPAVATLALGVGAATAIFTVFDRVVLRPLPYNEPNQLVYIDSRVRAQGSDVEWGVSEAGYFYLREHNRTFEELGAYGSPGSDPQFTMTGRAGGQRVNGAWVRGSLLEVLRARPVLGRLIQDGDDRPGLPKVALLGHEFWVREYGGDRSIVGKTVELEGGWRVEVIGVLQPGFHLPESKVDVWVPLGLDPARPPNSFHGFKVIGRLRPGVTVADAERDLARVTGEFPTALPGAYSDLFMRESGFRTRATLLHTRVLGRLSGVLWILLGSVGIVLLIACTNVANLFLVRAEVRRRERAIRVALGTSRLRLAREALSESLLLTLAAAAIGVVLAQGALRVLLTLAPANLPRMTEVAVGGASVTIAFGIALAAGIAFGCLPLRHAGDMSALQGGGTAITSSRHRHLVRGAMVVAQMALALVLLASAGLLLRSFERLRAVEPGFDARGVLTVDVFLPSMHDSYRRPQHVQQFYRELLERVNALPGVEEVGAGGVPLRHEPTCFATYVEARPLGPGEQPPCISLYTVTPGLFKTLRIPLQGREPNWATIPETDEATREVVVTRTLANRLWPGENPIGRGLRQAEEGPPYHRVVGVTAEVRGEGLDRAPAEAIFGQMRWDRGMTLVVRTGGDPNSIAAAVRRTIVELAPVAAVGNIQTMPEVIAASPSMTRTSFTMLLLGIGAFMGLLLSAVGLFGVLAYLVNQRRSEIGIRMALGAQPRAVANLVVRHALTLAILGAAFGLVAAFATTRLLRSLLFEIPPGDPLTLVLVTGVLMAVAIVATYFPARRAARVDPLIALRSE